MIGTISLQHDLFPESSSFIPRTIQIVTDSSYSLQNVAECSGLRAYDDAWLNRVIGNTTSNPTQTTSSVSQTGPTESPTASQKSHGNRLTQNIWIFFSIFYEMIL